MPSVTTKSGNNKPCRSKSKPTSVSDPKTSNHILSGQSSTTKLKKSSKICSTNEPAEIPKNKKLFTLVPLKGLGCRGVYSPASVPTANRPPPDKLKKKKHKKKKQSKSVMYNGPEVCCTPPKIGVVYDVAPSGRLKNHKKHTRLERQTVNLGHVSPLPFPFSTTSLSRTNVSNSRQYHRLQQLPEIIMLHNGSLSERSLNLSDRFGDWRLNLDPMLYEELLVLSDRIGYVGAGLQEDEILAWLSDTNKNTKRSSLSYIMSRNDEIKCSICQEECEGNDDLGRLACGHYHHIDCIKRWLLLKNECPLCKTTVVISK